MIQYTCPKCASTVAADEAKAGQSDTCPNCGNTNVVPQAAGPEPQPQAPQAEAPPDQPSPGPTPQGAPTETAPVTDKDTRMWGMLCHLAGLCVLLPLPLVNIVAPLVIWLIQKDKDPFIDDQGKEAVNFQITVSIALLVSGLLIFALVGWFLAPAVIIADVVLTIIGAMKANEGERHRYPISIRLIK